MFTWILQRMLYKIITVHKSIIIKTALVILIFFVAIFFLDKINMSAPTTFIYNEGE